jgi:hemerythrin-like domain-containing protein
MPGKNPSGPADTRDMVIVHDALRRDLGRARAAIGGSAAVPDSQRRALAGHLRWMMDFLHHHHQGEDRGLWPRVRAKNPESGVLLDAMEAAHRSVDPRVTKLDEAAGAYRDGGSGPHVVAAIDSLESALLPHLHEEEVETMPLVSASITQADWDDYNAEENIGTRSQFQLGITGHWMMDGLTPQRAALVTGLVPPTQRFALVHGIGPVYRRRARARWGGRADDYGVRA